MTAKTVLESMLARYAAMKSYQDRGVVLLQSPDEEEPYKIIFSTYFVRPAYFRFEWRTHHPYPPLRHLKTNRVIWCDGTDSFLWSDREGGSICSEDSLASAIAGATGVSHSSALTVSNILMPDLGQFLKIDNLNCLNLSEETFETTPCYCVQGVDSSGDPNNLYIGNKDFTLRGVSAVRPDAMVSNEIRREIRVDEPIDEKIFQFQQELGRP